MEKREFFTSQTRAWAVPVDCKLWNHTWVKDNAAVVLKERIEVDLSVVKVRDEVVHQDLMAMRDLAVPELGHSPGESVESVQDEEEHFSEQEEDSSSKGKGEELEERHWEVGRDVDDEGDADPEVVLKIIE